MSIVTERVVYKKLYPHRASLYPWLWLALPDICRINYRPGGWARPNIGLVTAYRDVHCSGLAGGEELWKVRADVINEDLMEGMKLHKLTVSTHKIAGFWKRSFPHWVETGSWAHVIDLMLPPLGTLFCTRIMPVRRVR